MSGRIDKTELIKKLRDLEGLTDEEKSNLIGLLRQHKKYGLVWEDKPEDVEERLREELPVLKEVKERALISDQPDAPNHILIEGDNLEALTALSYTHEGKIDVIYIDPPYNTGNKDFVYNDSYVDTEDSYRHSKWLSFMSKRIHIAKQLLSDKGVIFISIDDNEQANLRQLCDSIFLSSNYCGTFVWRKKSGGGQTDQFFVTEHEYVLVYQKTTSFTWLDKKISVESSSFKYKDERGLYNLTKLEKWGSAAHREDRQSMYFPINNPQSEEYYPIAPDGKPGRWRVGKPRMDYLEKNGLIEWRRNVPYEKKYYNGDDSKIIKARSILYEIGETGDGSNMLTEIFGEKDSFNNPKPLSLIKELLTHNTNNTILDFFAGSGTTLHATMQLNAEDGGHRQCILVTNNENGICEQVTYERNKRVIQGYTTPKGQAVEGLHDNNLRYYRTEFIPRERTQCNMRALVNAATDLLCIKENLYEQKPLLGTLKLKPQLARYFSDGQKHMLVVYREEVVNELVEAIKPLELGSSILKIYIFSPGRYAFDDDFYEVQDKVQLVALPAAIYDAYQRVLPKQKERLLVEAEEPAPQPTASVMTIDFEEGGEQ